MSGHDNEANIGTERSKRAHDQLLVRTRLCGQLLGTRYPQVMHFKAKFVRMRTRQDDKHLALSNRETT